MNYICEIRFACCFHLFKYILIGGPIDEVKVFLASNRPHRKARDGTIINLSLWAWPLLYYKSRKSFKIIGFIDAGEMPTSCNWFELFRKIKKVNYQYVKIK